MGMSYRAAMVPMMLTVVGTVLTPASVTDTVGMGTLLATFFTPNAWVSRMANKTATAAIAIGTVIVAVAGLLANRVTQAFGGENVCKKGPISTGSGAESRGRTRPATVSIIGTLA